MSEKEFIDGLSFKPPHGNAPEYVKAKGGIRREALIAWLESRDGEWVNFDVKVSQGGKWYAAVDNWKPNGEAQEPKRGGGPVQQRGERQPARDPQESQEFGDEIPFVTCRGVW